MAASIGTEVYYCRARLFGSRLGLPCKILPWAVNLCPLSSCRMWTVCMINCLRYASYHADTGPLEPLMCRSQVRVPWGEWVNSTTDFDLKTTGSKQKSTLQCQERHRFHTRTRKYKSSPTNIIIRIH
jgi:hypothetical protein